MGRGRQIIVAIMAAVCLAMGGGSIVALNSVTDTLNTERNAATEFGDKVMQELLTNYSANTIARNGTRFNELAMGQLGYTDQTQSTLDDRRIRYGRYISGKGNAKLSTKHNQDLPPNTVQMVYTAIVKCEKSPAQVTLILNKEGKDWKVADFRIAKPTTADGS